MKRRAFFSVLVLVLIGAVVWACCFAMKKMAREQAAPAPLERYSWEKVLSLTETQRADIRPLQEAFQENLAKVREKRVTEEMALCTILSRKETGLKEIEAQTKKVCELQSREQMLLSRHLQDVGRFLTVSQRETFMNTIKQELCRQTMASGLIAKDVCGMCGQGR